MARTRIQETNKNPPRQNQERNFFSFHQIHQAHHCHLRQRGNFVVLTNQPPSYKVFFLLHSSSTVYATTCKTNTHSHTLSDSLSRKARFGRQWRPRRPPKEQPYDTLSDMFSRSSSLS
jgi:hypothetical protein